MKEPNISEALTWDELADLYPGIARIMPMLEIFEWAENQPKKFYVCPENETVHLILKENRDD